MRGIPALAIAVAVLIAASACSTSHTSAQPKIHVKSVAQQGQEVIDPQKQVPPLQTAGQFCLAGIQKDSKDTAIDAALNTIDPTGGQAAAWQFSSLQGANNTATSCLHAGTTVEDVSTTQFTGSTQ